MIGPERQRVVFVYFAVAAAATVEPNEAAAAAAAAGRCSDRWQRPMQRPLRGVWRGSSSAWVKQQGQLAAGEAAGARGGIWLPSCGWRGMR
jgi:hypothetical protein